MISAGKSGGRWEFRTHCSRVKVYVESPLLSSGGLASHSDLFLVDFFWTVLNDLHLPRVIRSRSPKF